MRRTYFFRLTDTSSFVEKIHAIITWFRSNLFDTPSENKIHTFDLVDATARHSHTRVQDHKVASAPPGSLFLLPVKVIFYPSGNGHHGDFLVIEDQLPSDFLKHVSDPFPTTLNLFFSHPENQPIWLTPPSTKLTIRDCSPIIQIITTILMLERWLPLLNLPST